MKEYIEKVKNKATEIVEMAMRVERMYVYKENNVAEKLCLILMLGNMNPSISENVLNKSELCYHDYGFRYLLLTPQHPITYKSFWNTLGQHEQSVSNMQLNDVGEMSC